MVTTSLSKVDVPPCDLQQAIDDHQFAVEIRQGVLVIARAIAKRYGCKWILYVLGDGTYQKSN